MSVTIKNDNRVETEIYTERLAGSGWVKHCIWRMREERGPHTPTVDLARRNHEDLIRREATFPGFVDGVAGDIPNRFRFVVVDHEIYERIVTAIVEQP